MAIRFQGKKCGEVEEEHSRSIREFAGAGQNFIREVHKIQEYAWMGHARKKWNVPADHYVSVRFSTTCHHFCFGFEMEGSSVS